MLFCLGLNFFVLMLIGVVVLVSQFCSNTLFLGGYLLVVCLLVFFLLSFMKMVWYGLLFFLVYVGGLLVLFIYVFSLKSNPFSNVFFKMKSMFMFSFLFFFFFFLVGSVEGSFGFFLNSFVETKSYELFNQNEVLCEVFVGLFLVFSLLVISYLTSCVKSALRPFWH